ncbi:MAG: hypothetical protein ACP5JJ_18240, partial [Anaerolineae bacterium]
THRYWLQNAIVLPQNDRHHLLVSSSHTPAHTVVSSAPAGIGFGLEDHCGSDRNTLLTAHGASITSRRRLADQDGPIVHQKRALVNLA